MKPIITRMTMEVIGAPKEHVEKALKEVLRKLKEEKEISVIKIEAYECQQMENKLWSTFADIEFKTETLKRVLDICYDYMPGNIEILEPAGIEMDCNDFANVITDFLVRLHKYAFVLKKLKTENIYMMKELEKKE